MLILSGRVTIAIITIKFVDSRINTIGVVCTMGGQRLVWFHLHP